MLDNRCGKRRKRLLPRPIGRVGGRHDRQERGAPIGMAYGEGERGKRTGGAADHWNSLDLQCIEKVDEGVRLVLRGKDRSDKRSADSRSAKA